MMPLADLLDPAALSTRSPPGISARESWGDLGRGLLKLGYTRDTLLRAFFVPGRIELLGKHTDYAGGRSLVAATEPGIHLAVVTRRESVLGLHDLGRGLRADLDLEGDLAPPAGDWRAYPSAVARRARDDFDLRLDGADVVFDSSLPEAAGMSSSSALVVATWLALAASSPIEQSAVYRREIDRRERLAEYLAAVEAGRAFGRLQGGRGVGTHGGSEDHVAILCCRAGHLSQFSYLPARHEKTVALPPGLTFALAVSGVRAEKSGEVRRHYNRLSRAAHELTARWRRKMGRNEPHLAAILARGAGAHEALARIARGAPDGGDLTRRLEHFLAESNSLVSAASEALAAGSLQALGRVADRSQSLAERLLANQVPETVHLAASARRLGAHAASAFGAGFGGAVWALVDDERQAAFLDRWQRDYLDAFPGREPSAEFLVSRPGPGCFELGSQPAPV